MIITVQELKERVNCGALSDNVIKERLSAIEAVIRAYTNNKFQVRAVRFVGNSDGSFLYGDAAYFRIGDTVEISESGIDDGLYTVVDKTAESILIDSIIFPCDEMLVTKVEYPADVKECAIDLFNWKMLNGDKVGIKSETISRHSVTYEDSGSLFMGYPTGILSGLSLHKKMRY